MRIPLLVCGTPKNLEITPVVHISVGRYSIVMDNVIDSTVSLAEFTYLESGPFSIEFIHKGSETNLNIYAERIE